MIRRNIETTDKKYIGLMFDDSKPLTSSDEVTFHPTKNQNLGDGLVRYSNYIVLTKEVTNGKDN